jgi:hypothetical protein
MPTGMYCPQGHAQGLNILGMDHHATVNTVGKRGIDVFNRAWEWRIHVLICLGNGESRLVG